MHERGTPRFRAPWAIGLAAACLLAACGGDQVAGIQGSGTPAPASVTAVGPISSFGSIFVDGVEYATSGAQISIDDQPGTESELRVGQVVTIRGTVDADGTTGTASTVAFSDDLRGPATQIDPAAGTFVVLDQTVHVTDATLFDEAIQPADPSGLQSGAAVEVSGFANAEGELVASRVDLGSNGATLQVRGTVQALDTNAQTFRINTLTIDYSGIAPMGMLADASVVIVQGTTFSAGGALIATRVKVIPAPGAANDNARIEGVVTGFVSSADFEVNGQRVITDANTQFVPQGAMPALDADVKVRGTFDTSGALVAARVEVKSRTVSLVRGLVDSVSAAAGTLTILGVSITTDATTSFEDKSAEHLRSFRLTDVRTGDYVEVRGTADSSGGLVATLVERDRPESQSYLQGVVTSIANPNFTMLGITVATDVQTQFTGQGGGAAGFFGQALDHAVKVRGTLMGAIFLADRVQLRQ